MNKKKIIFKVSSSSTIGSGHILRVLKICEKLKNVKIYFITNNFKGNFNFLIKKYDLNVIKNSEKNFNSLKDLNDTKKILNKIKGEKILIVDNYLNSLSWQKIIYNYVDCLVIINDFFNNNFCDIYINENFKDRNFNKKIFKNKSCIKLIGSKYCLIGYKKIKKFKTKNNIFLFFGGSDKKNFTFQILNQLKNYKNLNFNIISNDKNLVKKLKRIGIAKYIIYPQNKNFFKVLARCDFAISSAGSTLWDIIYNNIPSISIAVADNQIPNLKELNKRKFTNWYKKKIDKRFKTYFDKHFLKKIRVPGLIDGMGVKRVIKVLNKT